MLLLHAGLISLALAIPLADTSSGTPFDGPLSLIRGGTVASASLADTPSQDTSANVLILGGGVTGVIAARQLAAAGVDFRIIEARSIIGGRMHDFEFGGVNGSQQVSLELGCNWVQGTQEGNSAPNPIWLLAQKHNVTLTDNDWSDIALYNASGQVDYSDVFNNSVNSYSDLTVAAGARVQTNTVDLTSRSGYRYTGWKPTTPEEMASEYYQFDWEYADTPEKTSWIASSYGNNYTYDPDSGGFGGDNLMAIDQNGGFKKLILGELNEFIKPGQVVLNATVADIAYNTSGVTVTLQDGTQYRGNYALVTFSVGVLQNDDVTFTPALPDWKNEAIQSSSMQTYTKFFLQFPSKFWDDHQMGLWADPNMRGRYPVWQSLDHAGFLPGSNIFFVTTTGDFSVYAETLTDQEAQDEIMGVLRLMFPNITVPDPLAFHFPRWHSDPLFRGSYSNWPPSFYSQHLENLKATVDGRLYFAGEATSYKWFGFLTGAYEEGRAAGNSIAATINGNQKAQSFPNIPAVEACGQFAPSGFSSP